MPSRATADALADLARDLLPVRRDADRVLGGEHAKDTVRENRADVLRNVDVAASADAVEQLQHRRRGNLVGEPDADLHGLVVHRVDGQVAELEGVEAGLDGVDGVDERHLEVEAGADRFGGHDGAEAAHAGHLGRLDRVEASERSRDQGADPDEDRKATRRHRGKGKFRLALLRSAPRLLVVGRDDVHDIGFRDVVQLWAPMVAGAARR